MVQPGVHGDAGAPGDGRHARVCLITHPPEGAAAFARSLVERRLAACVNRVAVQSTYRWEAGEGAAAAEGGVEEDAEVLLVVKTSAERLDALAACLRDEHPYDVPELVALRPTEIAPSYLGWLLSSVDRAASDG